MTWFGYQAALSTVLLVGLVVTLRTIPPALNYLEDPRHTGIRALILIKAIMGSAAPHQCLLSQSVGTPIYMLTFALRFRRRCRFQQATYVIEKPTGTAQVYMADGSTRVVQGSDGFRALRANPAVPPSSPNGSILPR